ncbi:MAG: Gfo/Idh/MocA family oxidoreductase [Clostridia bacterium]|nr:Gfo/Idh/MocA family oxidoreductase [Clostridia bacterium]
MNERNQITVALIGLGFGDCFAPIYAAHPNVERLVLVDSVTEKAQNSMNWCRNFNKNVVVYDSFDDVLKDDSIDAVHVCTGIPNHGELSAAVLNAGKHCACAVPMAISLEDVRRVVEAARHSGKNYMMMETEIYEAAFLYAREMLKRGEFGRIQFMRGIHHQCMDHGAWNTDTRHYWQGLPPMWYITHALSPLRVVADSQIRKVACFGSGTMDEIKVKNYNNPYPAEDMLIRFESGLAAEVSRMMHECSVKQTESYNIYGSKKSFLYEYMHEVWEQFYDETQYDRVGFHTEVVKYPNRYDLLPEEIRRFTVAGGDRAENWRELLDTAPLSLHSGSHPHLVHEFVSSIVENRKSAMDEDISANIVATGICAHMSAMNGGNLETVPEF